MKNKEKYDLKELKIKWRDLESMEIYADDGVYRINSNSNAVLLRGLVNWLEDEYKEPILDEKEKEYLSAVIKPWRDKVKDIFKTACNEYDYIVIEYYDNGYLQAIRMPLFEKGTMYKDMELARKYSVEDLGL